MILESQCIRCGCTDSRACPGGCSWAVRDSRVFRGICSRCVKPDETATRLGHCLVAHLNELARAVADGARPGDVTHLRPVVQFAPEEPRQW